MVKRKAPFSFWIVLTFIVLSSIAVSIKFIDAVLAERIMTILSSIKPLHKVTENIPDMLTYLVAIGTMIMWIVYFYRHHKKKLDVETMFLKVAATALPAVYFVKLVLQFTFGRTSPRDWLISHEPLVFNFISHSGGSFPSGHMTVFTAFGTAVLLHYPKYKKPVIILLALFGSALIGTDYHFLSDVIAGAYLGFTATYFLWRLFERNET